MTGLCNGMWQNEPNYKLFSNPSNEGCITLINEKKVLGFVFLIFGECTWFCFCGK